MVRRIVAWGPAAAQMIAIFAVSSIEDLGPLPANWSDHTWHFLAYCVLAACFLWAFAFAYWRAMSVRAGIWAVVAASAYGATDEFHQSFVPGRTTDVNDWIADTLGAVAAVAIIVLAVMVARRVFRRSRAI